LSPAEVAGAFHNRLRPNFPTRMSGGRPDYESASSIAWAALSCMSGTTDW
jgi:hypothetical protein